MNIDLSKINAFDNAGGGGPLKKKGSTEVRPPAEIQHIDLNKLNYLVNERRYAKPLGPISDDELDAGATYTDWRDMEDRRGRLQSRWDKWGNAGINTGVSLVLGTIKSISDMPDMARAYHGEMGLAVIADEDYQNPVSAILGDLINASNKKFQIHQDIGARGFNPFSASWVTSSVPTIVSGLTMMIPGIGAAKAVSLIPKGINWLSKGLKIAAPIFSEKAINMAASAAGALVGNAYETYLELGPMMQAAKAALLKNGYTEEETNKILNEEANNVYLGNLWNTPLDMIGFYHIAKGFSPSVVKGVFFPQMVKKYATSTVPEIAAMKELALGTAVKESFPEGVQELNNHYQNMRFQRHIDIKLGTAHKDYELGEFLTDPQAWTAGFWGALSGSLFTAGGSAVNQIGQNWGDKQSTFKNVGNAMMTGVTTHQKAYMEMQGKAMDETHGNLGKYLDMMSIAEIAGDKELYKKVKNEFEIETAIKHMYLGTYKDYVKLLDKTQQNLQTLKDKGADVGDGVEELENHRKIIDRAEKHYLRGSNIYDLKDRVLGEYVRMKSSLDIINERLDREKLIKSKLYEEDPNNILRSKLSTKIIGLLNEVESIMTPKTKDVETIDEEGNKVVVQEEIPLTDAQKKRAKELIEDMRKIKNNEKSSITDIAEAEVAQMSMDKKLYESDLRDILSGKRQKEIKRQEDFIATNVLIGSYMYGSAKKPGIYQRIDDLTRNSQLADIYDVGINDNAMESLDNDGSIENAIVVLNGITPAERKNDSETVIASMTKPSVYVNGRIKEIISDKEDEMSNLNAMMQEMDSSVDPDKFVTREMKVDENMSPEMADVLREYMSGMALIRMAKSMLNKYNQKNFIDKAYTQDEAAHKMISDEVNDIENIIDKVDGAVKTDNFPDEWIMVMNNLLSQVQGFIEHDKKYKHIDFSGISKKLTTLENKIEALNKEILKRKKSVDSKQNNSENKYKADIIQSIRIIDSSFNSSSYLEISNKVNDIRKKKKDYEQGLKDKRTLLQDKIFALLDGTQVMNDHIKSIDDVMNNPEVLVYSIVNGNSIYVSQNKEYQKTNDMADVKGQVLKDYPRLIDMCIMASDMNRLNDLLTSEYSYGDILMAEAALVDSNSNVQPTKEQEAAIRRVALMFISGKNVISGMGLAGTGKTSMLGPKVVAIMKKLGYSNFAAIAKFELQFNNINEQIFGKSNTFENFFESQEKMDKLFMSNDLVIIDESGAFNNSEYDMIANAIQNAKDKSKETGRTPRLLFLGDPMQRKEKAYFKPLFSLRSMKYNAFNTHTVPSLTIQQRTSNVDIETLQKIFVSSDEALVSGRDEIAKLTHNIERTYGVETMLEQERFNALLRERDKSDGTTRILVVDSKEKKEKYKGLQHINVVFVKEVQGLDKDEVYIDMEYDSVMNLIRNNNDWYTAISRSKKYINILHPLLPITRAMDMHGAEKTSMQLLVDTWNKNAERYKIAMDDFSKGFSKDNKIPMEKPETSSSDADTKVEGAKGNDSIVEDIIENAKKPEPVIKDKVHARNKGIRDSEVKDGDEVVFTYGYKEYKGKKIPYKVYLKEKDGVYHQIGIEFIDMPVEDLPVVSTRYKEGAFTVAGKAKIKSVNKLSYVIGEEKKNAEVSRGIILQSVRTNILGDNSTKSSSESRMKYSWVNASQRLIDELGKHMPEDFDLKKGATYLYVQMEGRKPLLIEYDSVKMTSDLQGNEMDYMSNLNKFFTGIRTLENTLSQIIGEDVKYCRWGDDNIIPEESFSFKDKAGKDRTRDLSAHYIFMSALDYEYVNEQYVSKSKHISRTVKLYEAINALPEDIKKQVISQIDEVRSMLYTLKYQNKYQISNGTYVDKSRNLHEHIIIPGTKNVLVSKDSIAMDETLMQTLEDLRTSGYEFELVQRSNKDKQYVLRTTFNYAGEHGTVKKERMFHVKMDYPLVLNGKKRYIVDPTHINVTTHQIKDNNVERIYETKGDKKSNVVDRFDNPQNFVDSKIPIAEHETIENAIVDIINNGVEAIGDGVAQVAINKIARSNDKIRLKPDGENIIDGDFVSVRRTIMDEDFEGRISKSISISNKTGGMVPIYSKDNTLKEDETKLVTIDLRTLFEEVIFNISEDGAVVDNPELNQGFGLRFNIDNSVLFHANNNNKEGVAELNSKLETRVEGYKPSSVTIEEEGKPTKQVQIESIETIKANIENRIGIELSNYNFTNLGPHGALSVAQIMTNKDNDGTDIAFNQQITVLGAYDLGDRYFAIKYKSNGSQNNMSFKLWKKGNVTSVTDAFVNSGGDFYSPESSTIKKILDTNNPTLSNEYELIAIKSKSIKEMYDAELKALESSMEMVVDDVEMINTLLLGEIRDDYNNEEPFKEKGEDGIVRDMSGDQEFFNPMSLEQAYDVVKRIIPTLSKESIEGVYHLKNLTGNNVAIHSRYQKGVMYLLYGFDGTVDEQQVRHEVFHKLYNQYLKPWQIKKLVRETRRSETFMRNARSDGFDPNTVNELYVEEYLAERFQQYNLGKQYTPKTFMGRIWQFLRNILLKIETVLSYRDRHIVNMLEMMDRGLFSKELIANDEIPFYRDLRKLQSKYLANSLRESIEHYFNARAYVKEMVYQHGSISNQLNKRPKTLVEVKIKIREDLARKMAEIIRDEKIPVSEINKMFRYSSNESEKDRTDRFIKYLYRVPADKRHLFHLFYQYLRTDSKGKEFITLPILDITIAELFPHINNSNLRYDTGSLNDMINEEQKVNDVDSENKVIAINQELIQNKLFDNQKRITRELREFLSVIKSKKGFVNAGASYKILLDTLTEMPMDRDSIRSYVETERDKNVIGTPEYEVLDAVYNVFNSEFKQLTTDIEFVDNTFVIYHNDNGVRRKKNIKVAAVQEAIDAVKKHIEESKYDGIRTSLAKQDMNDYLYELYIHGLKTDIAGKLMYIIGNNTRTNPYLFESGYHVKSEMYKFFITPFGMTTSESKFLGRIGDDIKEYIHTLQEELNNQPEEKKRTFIKTYFSELNEILTSNPKTQREKASNVKKILDKLGIVYNEYHNNSELISIYSYLKDIAKELVSNNTIKSINDIDVDEFVSKNRNYLKNVVKVLSKTDDYNRASSYYDTKGNRIYLYQIASYVYNIIKSIQHSGKNTRTLFVDTENPISKNNIYVTDKMDREHIEFETLANVNDTSLSTDLSKLSHEQFIGIRFIHGFVDRLVNVNARDKTYYQFVARQSNRDREDMVQTKILDYAGMVDAMTKANNMTVELIAKLKQEGRKVYENNGRYKLSSTSENFKENVKKQVFNNDVLKKMHVDFKAFLESMGNEGDKYADMINQVPDEYLNDMLGPIYKNITSASIKKYKNIYIKTQDLSKAFVVYSLWSLNNHINGFHLNALVGTPDVQVKNGSFRSKRFQAVGSPTSSMVIGKDFAPATFKYAVFSDVSRTKTFIDDVKKIYKKIYNKNWDTTDGMTFILPSFLDSVKRGTRDYELGNVLKNMIYGKDENGITHYIKTASFVLTDELCDMFPEAKEMRDDMLKNGTDMMIADSAYKVGAPAKSIPNGRKITKSYEMSFKLFGLQLNPVHDENAVANPSQLNYFLNTNGLNESEAHTVYDADRQLMNIRWDEFSRAHNIIDKKGNFNINAFKKYIIGHLSENDERIADLLDNGVSINFPAIQRTMMIQMSSVMAKNSIKHEQNGRKLILRTAVDTGMYMSEDGHFRTYDKVRDGMEKNPTEQKAFTDGVDAFSKLPFKTKEASKTIMDILDSDEEIVDGKEFNAVGYLNDKMINLMASDMSKAERNEFKIKVTELIENYGIGASSLNSMGVVVPRRLKMRDKDGFTEVVVPAWWLKEYNIKPEDLVSINYLHKTGMAVRIPTTEKHVSMAIKIVGTINTSDNMIIGPDEIVALHGSDFDVDSLSVFYRESYKKTSPFVLKDYVSEEKIDVAKEDEIVVSTFEMSRGDIYGYDSDLKWSNVIERVLLKYAPAYIKEGVLANKKLNAYISVIVKEENKSDMNTDITFQPIKQDLFDGIDEYSTDENVETIFEYNIKKSLSPETIAELDILDEEGNIKKGLVNLETKGRNTKLVFDEGFKSKVMTSSLGAITKIKVLTGMIDVIRSADFESAEGQWIYHQDNFGGAEGIGIQASALKVYAYLMYGTKFTVTNNNGKKTVFDGKTLSYDDIVSMNDHNGVHYIKMKDGSTVSGKLTRDDVMLRDNKGKLVQIKYNGHVYDRLRKTTVRDGNNTFANMDTIGNGYIDNVKEQVSWIINATSNSIETIALMAQMGYELYDEIPFILNSPAVSELVALGTVYDKQKNGYKTNRNVDVPGVIDRLKRTKKTDESFELSYQDIIDFTGKYYQKSFNEFMESNPSETDVRIQYAMVKLFDEIHNLSKTQFGINRIISTLLDFSISKEKIEDIINTYDTINFGEFNEVLNTTSFESPLFKTIPNIKGAIDMLRKLNEYVSKMWIYSDDVDSVLLNVYKHIGISIPRDYSGEKARAMIRKEFAAFVASSFIEKAEERGIIPPAVYVAIDPFSKKLHTLEQTEGRLFSYKKRRDADRNALLVSLNKEQSFVQDFIINDFPGIREKYQDNAFVGLLSTEQNVYGMLYLKFAGANGMTNDQKLAVKKGFMDLATEEKEKFVAYAIMHDNADMGFKGFSTFIPAETTLGRYDGLKGVSDFFEEKIKSLDLQRLINVSQYFMHEFVKNHKDYFTINKREYKKKAVYGPLAKSAIEMAIRDSNGVNMDDAVDVTDIGIKEDATSDVNYLVLKDHSKFYIVFNSMIYENTGTVEVTEGEKKFTLTVYKPVGPAYATRTNKYDSQYENKLYKATAVNVLLGSKEFDSIKNALKTGNKVDLFEKTRKVYSKTGDINITLGEKKVTIMREGSDEMLQVYMENTINSTMQLEGTKKNGEKYTYYEHEIGVVYRDRGTDISVTKSDDSDVDNSISKEETIDECAGGGKGGTPKMKDGGSFGFTPGSKWGVVKDLKGLPKHSEGGVDISIDGGRVMFANGGNLYHAKDGLVIGGDMPPFGPVKSANPYVMSRYYNQPMVDKTILPDVNRPNLMGYNANEYKIGMNVDNKDVTVPQIVNGQYLDEDAAYRNYILTGEKFKEMDDPSSYSKYYDYVNKIGLMKHSYGGFLPSAAGGMVIGDPPKESIPPFVTSDIDEYNRMSQAYNDSSKLYNYSQQKLNEFKLTEDEVKKIYKNETGSRSYGRAKFELSTEVNMSDKSDLEKINAHKNDNRRYFDSNVDINIEKKPFVKGIKATYAFYKPQVDNNIINYEAFPGFDKPKQKVIYKPKSIIKPIITQQEQIVQVQPTQSPIPKQVVSKEPELEEYLVKDIDYPGQGYIGGYSYYKKGYGKQTMSAFQANELIKRGVKVK